ncbi:hypothetical protein CYJ37_04900 [Bacillus sp. UMB0728]|nr:hypothetical protein CYJ37_04900 [Bacillus sp. UMB0728]
MEHAEADAAPNREPGTGHAAPIKRLQDIYFGQIGNQILSLVMVYCKRSLLQLFRTCLSGKAK